MHSTMKEISMHSLNPRNFAENPGEFLAMPFEEHEKLPRELPWKLSFNISNFVYLRTVHHTQQN